MALSETCVRWQIVEASNRFKIEFPITSIMSIALDTMDGNIGQLKIELLQAPQFFMEITGSTGTQWTQCRDFTEGHQASSIFQHVLTGSFSCLQTELMTLMNMDTYFSHICHINAPTASTLSQSQPAILSATAALAARRPSLSFEDSLGLQRRGSAPASVMFDQNAASFMMRRASVYDSPLLDNATLDSPLASPLGTPQNLSMEMSPSPHKLTMFDSPNLNNSFNSLAVNMDDFKIDSGSFSMPSDAPSPGPATPGTAASDTTGANTEFLIDIAQFLDSGDNSFAGMGSDGLMGAV